MKKLILSLTIVSLLIFPLGAAALTQSQQESLPAVSTEEVHGNVPRPDQCGSGYDPRCPRSGVGYDGKPPGLRSQRQ